MPTKVPSKPGFATETAPPETQTPWQKIIQKGALLNAAAKASKPARAEVGCSGHGSSQN